jgi:hypothetical protein
VLLQILRACIISFVSCAPYLQAQCVHVETHAIAILHPLVGVAGPAFLLPPDSFHNKYMHHSLQKGCANACTDLQLLEIFTAHRQEQ